MQITPKTFSKSCLVKVPNFSFLAIQFVATKYLLFFFFLSQGGFISLYNFCFTHSTAWFLFLLFYSYFILLIFTRSTA